jgi:hypothetical protein
VTGVSAAAVGTGTKCMKIDCLMGTYGRYSLACEALACFLQQTALTQASLLIYNQHPVPLTFDHPRVRVVNEQPPPGSLRYIKRRMIELANPEADLIHFWDDDDLALPWHLEDCFAHIGDHVAWRPVSVWMSERNKAFRRLASMFEGSFVFRADYLRAAPLDTHPAYIDHPVYLQAIEACLLAETELGGRSSYIYRWDTGTQHLSGYGGRASETTQRVYIDWWRRRSTDVRADGVLVPANMTLRWRQYLDGTRALVTAEEFERNREGVQL